MGIDMLVLNYITFCFFFATNELIFSLPSDTNTPLPALRFSPARGLGAGSSGYSLSGVAIESVQRETIEVLGALLQIFT